MGEDRHKKDPDIEERSRWEHLKISPRNELEAHYPQRRRLKRVVHSDDKGVVSNGKHTPVHHDEQEGREYVIDDGGEHSNSHPIRIGRVLRLTTDALQICEWDLHRV